MRRFNRDESSFLGTDLNIPSSYLGIGLGFVVVAILIVVVVFVLKKRFFTCFVSKRIL